MEGRRIHGEGFAHEQDYIEERLEQTSDSDEYAEAANILEDQANDLQGVTTGDLAAHGGMDMNAEVDTEALAEQATLQTNRMEHRQVAAMDTLDGTTIDVEQQPPTAEARTGEVQRSGGGAMGS